MNANLFKRNSLELEKLLDEPEYGEPWRPTPGDRLVGTVVRYGKYNHDQQGSRYFCVIRDDAGKLHCVYLNATVIMTRFTELRPEVGERIGIKRLESAGKSYKRFTVVVDRPGSSLGSIRMPWDEIACKLQKEQEREKTRSLSTADAEIPF